MGSEDNNIIVIGSSTGGPKLLNSLFSELPRLNASVIIVQHVPSYFDEKIAERLNDLSAMKVVLGDDKAVLENSTVYFARAEVHLTLLLNYRIKLQTDEKVNCCCPSIDVMMKSLRPNGSGKLVGVILTGMGRDGAEGISHIKKLGGITIAQDEESCVIYGMPKAAANTGDVDHILHKDEIGSKLVEIVGSIE